MYIPLCLIDFHLDVMLKIFSSLVISTPRMKWIFLFWLNRFNLIFLAQPLSRRGKWKRSDNCKDKRTKGLEDLMTKDNKQNSSLKFVSSLENPLLFEKENKTYVLCEKIMHLVNNVYIYLVLKFVASITIFLWFSFYFFFHCCLLVVYLSCSSALY